MQQPRFATSDYFTWGVRLSTTKQTISHHLHAAALHVLMQPPCLDFGMQSSPPGIHFNTTGFWKVAKSWHDMLIRTAPMRRAMGLIGG